MRTRGQVWAQAAYQKVEERAKGQEAREYKDMALKFPVLVRQAGLAQALAFVESRGKGAHKAFGEDLAQVLGHESLGRLGQKAREAELLEYLRLTREVLGAAEWFKRFAQALIQD